MIWALGWAHVVSWGTLYYGFPLFVLPMQQEFGWSLTLINGALSAGLLVAGLCTYGVGARIDRHGGRALMTAGSLGTAVLLVLWSQITSIAMLYGVWLLLGVCLAAILYEPAFMVVGRPRAGRAQIATRIRLATSQVVVAIAELSDGSYAISRAYVIVTIAACIEDLAGT